MNQNESLEVGSKITLTVSAETDEGHVYSAGEIGVVTAVGDNGDPTILVRFAGRPALAIEFDEDWTLTRSRALIA
jgi:hypothetical protein